MLYLVVASRLLAPEGDLRGIGYKISYPVKRRMSSSEETSSLSPSRPSAFDWMEEQLLTRSNGEDRVRHVLRQLHEEVKRKWL